MNFNLPNFLIQKDAPVSDVCLEMGLKDFHQVVEYVLKLPYRRNSSKENLTLVFKEKCGVCSTKHAALNLLALENYYIDVQLMVGIYEMNEKNTQGVGKVLEKYNLESIPEAHSYLIFENERVDVTKEGAVEVSPFDSLLEEVEIAPEQIGDWKVDFHQAFLKKWILEKEVEYSFEEVWKIREECILALSEK